MWALILNLMGPICLNGLVVNDKNQCHARYILVYRKIVKNCINEGGTEKNGSAVRVFYGVDNGIFFASSFA